MSEKKVVSRNIAIGLGILVAAARAESQWFSAAGSRNNGRARLNQS
jgi:hypothetical protein